MACLGCGPDPGVVQSADRALVGPISSCRPPVAVMEGFTSSYSALDAYNSAFTTTTTTSTTTTSSSVIYSTIIGMFYVDAKSGQFVAGIEEQSMVQP